MTVFEPFRIRSYRFQWPADLLTSWAFEMETLVLGWYVLVETGSVIMLTVFGALLYGGTLIAPILGVVSDRVGHRLLLSAMRASYAAIAATLMVLAFAGMLSPLLVCILAAVAGIVRPSDMGLRGALIAETMPVEPLDRRARDRAHHLRLCPYRRRARGRRPVRGLRHRTGLRRDHDVLHVRLGADVVSRRRCAWSPRPSRSGRTSSPALRRGATCARASLHIWNTPSLLALVWYAFLFNLTVFPITNGLLPYVAKDIYRIDQTGLGYLVASLAFGALLGAIAMSWSPLRIDLARLMIVSAWSGTRCCWPSRRCRPSAAASRCCCSPGIAQSLTMVSHTVILLRASGQRFRGRIMGVRMLAIYSLPLGLLAAGGLIGAIGFRVTASLYAATGLVFSVLIAWRWRAQLWPGRGGDTGV